MPLDDSAEEARLTFKILVAMWGEIQDLLGSDRSNFIVVCQAILSSAPSEPSAYEISHVSQVLRDTMYRYSALKDVVTAIEESHAVRAYPGVEEFKSKSETINDLRNHFEEFRKVVCVPAVPPLSESVPSNTTASPSENPRNQ